MSPVMTPRRERLKAQTRVEILDHAREQVAETGEVSLRRVAAAMGLTPAALYRYYPALGAVENVIAHEIAITAALDIDSGGWPDYVEWVVDNPNLFAFLAKHPPLLAQLHGAVAAAQAGAA